MNLDSWPLDELTNHPAVIMELTRFRQAKDAFFVSPDSPLTPVQRKDFRGLKYYSENPALRLRLPLDENVKHERVTMDVSTGGRRQYVRAGKMHFTVNHQSVELTVFRDDHGLFVPFRDATNQDETYAAGRYLEPEQDSTGNLRIDFNLAYNPYCAYNEQFSCPLPPRENWLNVRFEAGEKRFHD